MAHHELRGQADVHTATVHVDRVFEHAQTYAPWFEPLLPKDAADTRTSETTNTTNLTIIRYVIVPFVANNLFPDRTTSVWISPTKIGELGVRQIAVHIYNSQPQWARASEGFEHQFGNGDVAKAGDVDPDLTRAELPQGKDPPSTRTGSLRVTPDTSTTRHRVIPASNYRAPVFRFVVDRRGTSSSIHGTSFQGTRRTGQVAASPSFYAHRGTASTQKPDSC